MYVAVGCIINVQVSTDGQRVLLSTQRAINTTARMVAIL